MAAHPSRRRRTALQGRNGLQHDIRVVHDAQVRLATV